MDVLVREGEHAVYKYMSQIAQVDQKVPMAMVRDQATPACFCLLVALKRRAVMTRPASMSTCHVHGERRMEHREDSGGRGREEREEEPGWWGGFMSGC